MLNDNLQPCGDARYNPEVLKTTTVNQDFEQVKQSYGLNWKKPSEKPVAIMLDDYNKDSGTDIDIAESEPLFVHLKCSTELLYSEKGSHYEMLKYIKMYDKKTGEFNGEEWLDVCGNAYDEADIIGYIPVSEMGL